MMTSLKTRQVNLRNVQNTLPVSTSSSSSTLLWELIRVNPTSCADDAAARSVQSPISYAATVSLYLRADVAASICVGLTIPISAPWTSAECATFTRTVSDSDVLVTISFCADSESVSDTDRHNFLFSQPIYSFTYESVLPQSYSMKSLPAHLHMAVRHLSITFGINTFIQSGDVDISRNSVWWPPPSWIFRIPESGTYRHDSCLDLALH